MGREHLTYHFVPFKITSFLRRNSKRMLQIFLYEESQMYVIGNKYNKIFQYAHFSTHYFLLIDFPLLV